MPSREFEVHFGDARLIRAFDTQAEAEQAAGQIPGSRIVQVDRRTAWINTQPDRRHRILWNRRPDEHPGDIDEIVIDHPTMVHVEQLDTRCWWIGIYLNEDGEEPRRWSGHFSADSRGRMTFTEQDNDITWSQDESHEAPRFNPDPDLDASIRVPPRRRPAS